MSQAVTDPPSQPNQGRVGLLFSGWLMPALWLVQLPLSFWLVWNACAVQRTAHLVWIMGATAILAAITALASWRQRWRGVPAVDPEDAVADRIRFVAWIGMLLSVQILIVLVAQALALLILKPCD